MASWDVFHSDRLEVERGLSTAEVRAAKERGDLTEDDLIRPAGTSAPWARLADMPALLEPEPEIETSPPPAPPPEPAAPVRSPEPPTAVLPGGPPSFPGPTSEAEAEPEPGTEPADVDDVLEFAIVDDEDEDQDQAAFPDLDRGQDEEEADRYEPGNFPVLRPADGGIKPEPEPEAAGSDEVDSGSQEVVVWDDGLDGDEEGYDPQEEDEAAAEFTLTRSGPETVEELDLAAMVDVAFQLVLFFLVTATTVMFKSLEVPKPNPEAKPPAAAAQGHSKTLDDLKDDFILVEIDPAGAVKIDREPVPAELPALAERLRTARERTGRKAMLLSADFSTPHKSAVLAYDAANEIGLGIAIARPSPPGGGGGGGGP